MATYSVDNRYPTSGSRYTSIAALKAAITTAGHTIEFAEGSGPYYEEWYPTASQDGWIANFNGCQLKGNRDLSLYVQAGTHKWVPSLARPGEFYFTTLAGGNPWSLLLVDSTQVKSAIVDGVWTDVEMTPNGSSGSVIPAHSRNMWLWGDYDSIGFSTVYVYLLGGYDPTGAIVDVALRDYNCRILAGCTGHELHDINMSGANHVNIYDAETLIVKRGHAKNAYNEFCAFAGGGSPMNSVVNGVVIDSCGHRAFTANRTGIGPTGSITMVNNTIVNCHLGLLSQAGQTNVITATYRNNIHKDMWAGCISVVNDACTLIEDHNQFHINPLSPHGNKKIGFAAGGTSRWLTTAATDFPASTSTQISADGNPSACGVDPLITSSMGLSPSSVCVGSGASGGGIGITTDVNGDPVPGPCETSMGAVEYMSHVDDGYGMYALFDGTLPALTCTESKFSLTRAVKSEGKPLTNRQIGKWVVGEVRYLTIPSGNYLELPSNE